MCQNNEGLNKFLLGGWSPVTNFRALFPGHPPTHTHTHISFASPVGMSKNHPLSPRALLLSCATLCLTSHHPQTEVQGHLNETRALLLQMSLFMFSWVI